MVDSEDQLAAVKISPIETQLDQDQEEAILLAGPSSFLGKTGVSRKAILLASFRRTVLGSWPEHAHSSASEAVRDMEPSMITSASDLPKEIKLLAAVEIMMAPNCSLHGFWSLHIFCSLFLIAHAKIHQDEDDVWIDPFDMLNYDPTTKRMRKPSESASYPNMPTKRREFSSESCEAQQCPDVSECTSKLESLQKEFDEQKKNGNSTSIKPVFKRFLSRFLKETSELGLPIDGQTSMHYDAEVKLSKQSLLEIQKFLNEENDWSAEAMDEALSQILVRIKIRDHEAWKWRFEDTFCVDANTTLRVSLYFVLQVSLIHTELWSVVSWFVLFWSMFAVCFFISLIWNWSHLSKVFMYGVQAIFGWRRDQTPPAWGGDASQPLQDNKNRVNQAGTQGDQGFRAGDAYYPQNKQEDVSMDLPQNFSSRPRGTQRVETLRATGNMSRDDETDFQQWTEEVDPRTKENAVSADLAVKEGLSFKTPVQETQE
ncbi:chloride channel CLIC-like protein 1 [Garra rufa]|uniref:chloride channel CLIC-like protein 1 n=1 Tax=Garra rufa TaxID=137080 RepID=UPI003CCEC3D4